MSSTRTGRVLRRYVDTTGHGFALAEGLFVTFLWSSSYVLIKIGLESLPPLTFAGLRYIFAVGVLLAIMVVRGTHESLRGLSSRDWGWLVLLGVFWYALAPGTRYLGLARLPATTVSMLLSFAPALVAVGGRVTLGERMTRMQWAGIGLYVVGTYVYLPSVQLSGAFGVGLIVMGVCVVANAGSTLLGRYVNRDEHIPSVTVTLVSMLAGSVMLLATGVARTGVPTLTATGWSITLLLAVVNTAAAYTMWNHALRTLGAAEAGVLLSSITLQVAVLDVLFLGATVSPVELVGLTIGLLGVFTVQYWKP